VSVESDALAYYTDTALLSKQAIAAILALWRRLDAGNISGSWSALMPDAVAALVAAETVAAELADPYLSQVLDNSAASAAIDVGGMVEPSGSLLYLPAVQANNLIGQGLGVGAALTAAAHRLAMYTQTSVADTARSAVAAGMAARPHAHGYYRALRPPSCARCAILAGRFYKWNTGFKRHPRCFPAGTAVSGPAALAASRRWYEGELVVLATASGEKLSLTGNHPVLTSRGWVPANLLQEGDEVVRSTRPEGAAALVVPDHDQVPALIEDVWRSFGVTGLDRMPTTAEDFHGDGQDGEVDVVYADRALLHEGNAALAQHLGEPVFSLRLGGAGLLDRERVSELVDLRRAAHSGSGVGGRGLFFALLSGHLFGADKAGGAWPSMFDAELGEPTLDDVAAHAVLDAEGVLAGSGQVCGGDRLHGEFDVSPRWDAPAVPFSVQERGAYAARGKDLLQRLSGQVELDRVVDLRRVVWSGHVYSLTSSEGWHTANNLIVSNCDCVHTPVNEPDDRFEYDARAAIAAGQVTGLSKADLKAIVEYGANPAQVVNAKQAMYNVGQFQATNAATSRQSIGGARMLARSIDRTAGIDVTKQTYTNLTFDRLTAAKYADMFRAGKTYTRTTRDGRPQRYAYRFLRTPRPTAQQIVVSASSRPEAVRLLTNYGYII
jgi:hypothetical protein